MFCTHDTPSFQTRFCMHKATFFKCVFTKYRSAESTGDTFGPRPYNRNTIDVNKRQSSSSSRSPRWVTRKKAASPKVDSKNKSTLYLRRIKNATWKRNPARKGAAKNYFVAVNRIGNNIHVDAVSESRRF